MMGGQMPNMKGASDEKKLRKALGGLAKLVPAGVDVSEVLEHIADPPRHVPEAHIHPKGVTKEEDSKSTTSEDDATTEGSGSAWPVRLKDATGRIIKAVADG